MKIIYNKSDLWIFILYALLCIVFTYPLITNLHNAIAGDIPCDPPMFVWNYWNFGESLFQAPHNPFIAHKLLYPFSPNCVLHTYTVFRSAVITFTSSFINPVSAFNIVTILMFFFSAIGGYLLTRRFVSNRFACFISGFIFSFCSYKLARLSGHYNLVDSAFIPFYIISLFNILEKKDIKYPIFAGIFLALTGYCCYYYLVFLVLFTILFFAFYKIPDLNPSYIRKNFVVKRTPSGRTRLITRYITLLLGVPAAFLFFYIVILGPISPPPFSARSASRPLLILIILAIANWKIKHSIKYNKWFNHLKITGGNLIRQDYLKKIFILLGVFIFLFLPVLLNLLQEYSEYPSEVETVSDYPRIGDYLSFEGRGRATLNRILQISANPIERRVYLGIIPLILAIYAWKKFRKNPDVKFWILTGLIFFIFSLGPSLKIADRGLFWMPYNLIQALPFLKGAREPSRYIILTMMAIGILSAVSISHLLKQIKKKSVIILSISIAGFSLIAFDYATIPNDMIKLTVPEIYKSIGRDDSDYTILEVPFKIQGKGRELGGENYNYGMYQFYQTVHHKKLLSGYIAYIPFKVFDYFQNIGFIHDLCMLQDNKLDEQKKIEITDRPPRIESARAVELFDIRYIILHPKDLSSESISFIKKYLIRNLRNQFEEIKDENELVVFKRKHSKSGLFLNKNLIGRSFNIAFLEGWSPMQSDDSGKFRYLVDDKAEIVFPIKNLHDHLIEFNISSKAQLKTDIELEFYLNNASVHTFTVSYDQVLQKNFKVSIILDKKIVVDGLNQLQIRQDSFDAKKPQIIFNSIILRPLE